MPAISLGIMQRNWLEMYLFARESGRFTARRVSLCPCARGAKEENKTKTTNSPSNKQRKNKYKTKRKKGEKSKAGGKDIF